MFHFFVIFPVKIDILHLAHNSFLKSDKNWDLLLQDIAKNIVGFFCTLLCCVNFNTRSCYFPLKGLVDASPSLTIRFWVMALKVPNAWYWGMLQDQMVQWKEKGGRLLPRALDRMVKWPVHCKKGPLYHYNQLFWLSLMMIWMLQFFGSLQCCQILMPAPFAPMGCDKSIFISMNTNPWSTKWNVA